MPPSRLDHRVPMTLPTHAVPPPELAHARPHARTATPLGCNEQRYPTARKTIGRNTSESAPRKSGHAQARHHIQSGKCGTVSLAHVQQSNGYALGATANLSITRTG
jgi:hypothetical protein